MLVALMHSWPDRNFAAHFLLQQRLAEYPAKVSFGFLGMGRLQNSQRLVISDILHDLRLIDAHSGNDNRMVRGAVVRLVESVNSPVKPLYRAQHVLPLFFSALILRHGATQA